MIIKLTDAASGKEFLLNALIVAVIIPMNNGYSKIVFEDKTDVVVKESIEKIYTRIRESRTNYP
jgi:hypothetical protein